jgi:hypothetical protein
MNYHLKINMTKLLFSCVTFAWGLFSSFIISQQHPTRDSIINHLQSKIAHSDPLIVHIFVPLCDNEHQGIVPTSASLGNGMDLKSNLYWATSGGVKRFFKDHPSWNFVQSVMNPSPHILERVIFSRTFSNNAHVYVIADAYRGDAMKKCLSDFFNSLSGMFQNSITVNGKTLPIYSGADLLIFNGHNGLMDTELHFVPIDQPSYAKKDAVSISCASGNYFKMYYNQTYAYPLVELNRLLSSPVVFYDNFEI